MGLADGSWGNEKADELAREGSNKSMAGPEPFCGVPKTLCNASIKQWMRVLRVVEQLCKIEKGQTVYQGTVGQIQERPTGSK